MHLNIGKEVAVLQRMSTTELRARYAEIFGEATTANNKPWLIKRLAWRLQALAEGGLSERARQRAAELANDADLRLSPPRAKPATATPEHTPSAVQLFQPDGRLPPPGTIISRRYKGRLLQAQVLPHGFAFESEVFKSLSAVAKAATGQHVNGFGFFRFGQEGDR
jgi:hypothetical protein